MNEDDTLKIDQANSVSSEELEARSILLFGRGFLWGVGVEAFVTTATPLLGGSYLTTCFASAATLITAVGVRYVLQKPYQNFLRRYSSKNGLAP